MESKQKTARWQVLEILEEVFEEGAYSNIALNRALSQSPLSQADKGLVTELGLRHSCSENHSGMVSFPSD